MKWEEAEQAAEVAVPLVDTVVQAVAPRAGIEQVLTAHRVVAAEAV